MLRRSISAQCTSSFLASLLANKEKPVSSNQSSNVEAAAAASPTTKKKKMSVPLIFDPASLKLDVLPMGLSKKQQQAEETASSESLDFGLSMSKKKAATRAATPAGDDKILFPSFDDSSDYDAKVKRELQEQRRKNRTATPKYPTFSNSNEERTPEECFTLLSVSRRLGDWEEAMRVAAQQWKRGGGGGGGGRGSSSQDEDGDKSLLGAPVTVLQQQVGMAAQAAWACARAVELQMMSSEQQTGAGVAEDVDDDSSSLPLGPIHALNLITMHLVARIEKRQIPSSESQPTTTTTTTAASSENDDEETLLRRKCAFISATTGNIVQISEALRACGGIDLVMALDGCIGRVLRLHWKKRGLLLETQRWNHEMIKVYDLCDDWRGALGFFLHHCGVKPAAQQQQQQQQQQPKDDNANVEKEQDSSAVTPSSFEFKKKSAVAAAGQQSSASDPSIIGATTIAVLIELLSRNEKQFIVAELLGSKQLVREAERAAIARAFSVLISQWGSSSNATRRLRDGMTSGSDSASAPVGGTGLSVPGGGFYRDH